MADWIIALGLARLKEPSTWRGLIALATAFGVAIRPEVADAIIALGLALIGGANVITPEPVMPPRGHPADSIDRMHDDVPTPDSRPSVRLDTQRNAFKDLDRFE